MRRRLDGREVSIDRGKTQKSPLCSLSPQFRSDHSPKTSPIKATGADESSEVGFVTYHDFREARFYEQVTRCQEFVLCFSFIGLLLLLLLLVSLLSTGFLFALWMSCLDASSVPVGVREESRCLPFIGRPWKTKTRTQSSEHGVVATGKHGHISGSLFVERDVRLLGTPKAVKQHGKLAAATATTALLLACLPPSCGQDADPTVEAPNLVRAVEGYGWSTRSARLRKDMRCRHG